MFDHYVSRYGYGHSPGGYWNYHYPHGGYLVPYYIYCQPVPYCAMCQRLYHQCECSLTTTIITPQDVLVVDDPVSSPTTEEIFIGGLSDAKLTLEYRANTAPPPATSKVEVSISDLNGTVTSWQETPIPDGYNVKSDFPSVAPGSMISITVTEGTARLRWCEVLEC